MFTKVGINQAYFTLSMKSKFIWFSFGK